VKVKELRDELRTKTIEELKAELVQSKTELFNLRFQHATGQLENPIRIREVKKNIARIQTIITQIANQ